MPSTIKEGSTGPNVVTWQNVIKVTPDGVFGPATTRATKVWQAAHNLLPDGIVGVKSWAAAGFGPAPVAPLGLVEKIPYGTRFIDSLGFSTSGTAEQARALRSSPKPVEGVALYVGAATRARCEAVLDAGLGLFFVTKAGEYNDGSMDEVEYLTSIGYPAGASVALDVEGLPAFEAGKANPGAFNKLLKDWALGVKKAGYSPAEYIGAPQPSTSEELNEIGFDAFWLGIGMPMDRNQKLVYPRRGFCARQLWHNEKNGIIWPGTDVLVDCNYADFDHYSGRLNWVVRG